MDMALASAWILRSAILVLVLHSAREIPLQREKFISDWQISFECMKTILDYSIERTYWKNGVEYVACIDEAGRGPLAGPVVAAAVIFSPEVWIYGVNDSKKLNHHQREIFFDVIQKSAISVGVGIVPHDCIDQINIYQATMKAMADAVAALNPIPAQLLIDGPRYQNSVIPYKAIIDGDAQCFTIAAASIVAK